MQGKESDTRVTIYKKTDETYQLKLKAARAFYSEVTHKYGTMPFNLRGFDADNRAKLGVVECVTHKLIEPFQVLYEKPGQFIENEYNMYRFNSIYTFFTLQLFYI